MIESENNMWLCKRDLSKECEGKYKDCTDCVLDKIRAEVVLLKDYDKQYANKRILEIIDKYKTRGRRSEEI